MKYNCTECDKGLTDHKSMVCKKCRLQKTKLDRLSYNKEYKIKGHQINVVSQFKSTQQIVQNIFNNNQREILPVKNLSPEDFEVKDKYLNDFDYAKLMARKYKKVCRRCKAFSKQKIKTESQVRAIFYYVSEARKRLSNIKGGCLNDKNNKTN